ncbi:MAG: D-alanine--D-alanine ligase [Gammaproteobacteria bacterium]|nr:D-alanine--D-alanine ligase [Gammaproteobacteria bacterium]
MTVEPPVHIRKKEKLIVSPEQFGKVAVLMGGLSAEREISLKSGHSVLDALLMQGIDAHAIDADKGVIEKLLQGGYDRVFIILHGRGGEDGVIQGAIETLGLPYTGSGVLGSALCMDKLRSKQIWADTGISTPEYSLLKEDSEFDEIGGRLGFPLIVKPVHEGSSIGMSLVKEPGSFRDAWKLACEYDHEVIAEYWVDGDEYTAAILGRDVLPLIRLETDREFYDYEAKYIGKQTNYICPCGLDAELENELQNLALSAFDVVGAGGWGRVDFMLDKDQQPWLIEVNTVPGMTDHSLVPMAAKAAGINFNELVWKILETSYGNEGHSGNEKHCSVERKVIQ